MNYRRITWRNKLGNKQVIIDKTGCMICVQRLPTMQQSYTVIGSYSPKVEEHVAYLLLFVSIDGMHKQTDCYGLAGFGISVWLEFIIAIGIIILLLISQSIHLCFHTILTIQWKEVSHTLPSHIHVYILKHPYESSMDIGQGGGQRRCTKRLENPERLTSSLVSLQPSFRGRGTGKYQGLCWIKSTLIGGK